MRRGVEVRIIVPPSEAGSERTGSLPACAGIRMMVETQSCFVQDGTGVLLVDEAGGGEMFSATGVLEIKPRAIV